MGELDIIFSIPILQKLLPKNIILHWAFLVEAVNLLMKEEITNFEVDLADQLLHQFVSETEIIYTKTAMTFNVHSLLHLAKSVYNWGPLWVHNAYSFEPGNGELLKVIHAAKGVHHQICRRISLKYTSLLLTDILKSNFSHSVKMFCEAYKYVIYLYTVLCIT